MNETQNKVFAEALMYHLNEEAKNNALLANAMKKENKSEEELVRYVIMQTTHGDCKSVIIDGNEVMKIAIAYYMDDSIVVPNLSAPKKELPNVEPKPAPAPAQKPKTKAKKVETQELTLFDL